ncbi:hypothetical protein L0F63_003654, partial [Massospora cicadina]
MRLPDVVSPAGRSGDMPLDLPHLNTIAYYQIELYLCHLPTLDTFLPLLQPNLKQELVCLLGDLAISLAHINLIPLNHFAKRKLDRTPILRYERP